MMSQNISENDSQIVIYQSETGQTKIEVRLENEAVWLTHAGKVLHDMAKEIAEQAYDQFHQNSIFQSDKIESDFETIIRELSDHHDLK